MNDNNNCNSLLDEPTRKQSLLVFFKRLRIPFQLGGILHTTLSSAGVDCIEDLKHIPDDMWDDMVSRAKLKIVEKGRLMRTLEMLKETGEANPFLNEPIPIKYKDKTPCSDDDIISISSGDEEDTTNFHNKHSQKSKVNKVAGGQNKAGKLWGNNQAPSVATFYKVDEVKKRKYA